MEIWTQAQESGFLTKKIRKNVNKKEKTVGGSGFGGGEIGTVEKRISRRFEWCKNYSNRGNIDNVINANTTPGNVLARQYDSIKRTEQHQAWQWICDIKKNTVEKRISRRFE
jgi:hypothetical protein